MRGARLYLHSRTNTWPVVPIAALPLLFTLDRVQHGIKVRMITDAQTLSLKYRAVLIHPFRSNAVGDNTTPLIRQCTLGCKIPEGI